ncbi:MAG TPA: hypothetical protein VGE00_01025 [Gammaproteobacteria bacterium]
MGDRLFSLRPPLAALLLALLCSCAGAPPQPDERAACRALFALVDEVVEQHGVRDHGSAVLAEFPYLRMNRLLASLRDEVETPERFAAWSRRLAELDSEARRHELRNLVPAINGLADEALLKQLDECRGRLQTLELAEPSLRQRLRAQAEVPDSYVTGWRIVGLYPLTAPFVSLGINRWHRATQALFATPLDELPVNGTLTRWAAPRRAMLTAAQVAELLHTSRDALGLPQPAPADLQRLFDTFAPRWEVDVVSDDDRIGALGWDAGPQVKTQRPMLYRLPSHTRFNGELLLQLNYIVWFAARPGNDIYAGRLDGINWRVTLASDGTPLLYDLIHNCGCYYQALPSHKLRLRADLPRLYFEPPLQPQQAPEGLPVTLRIAAATHHLQRAFHDGVKGDALPLAWADYDTLRSLPAGDAHHSLFGDHGLVTASRRPERFLLWPMGVRSPGAMRQWGQHAIAFVGRRHFDDAHLLDTLFEPVPAP